MSLNREERRTLKKKIAPLAREIAKLEKQIAEATSTEEKQEYETIMSRIFDKLTMMEMFAIEDYITNKGLLDK